MDDNHMTRQLRAMLKHLGRAGGISDDSQGQGAAPSPVAGELMDYLSRSEWRAASSFMEGQSLAPSVHAKLFSIILPIGRPAVLVRDGDFAMEPSWQQFMDAPIHDTIVKALQAVGLIEIPGYDVYPLAGTGFLVGEGLVMTNRHVVEKFAINLGTDAMRFRDGLAPVINFHREVTSPPGDTSAEFAIEAVAWVHPEWDMALLRLSEAPGIKPLALARKPAPPEREIAALGYPGQSDPDSEVEQKIYQGIYNVKRLLPGLVHAMVAAPDVPAKVLSHDCSVLSGGSGSPLLDVRTGLVIGLHFHGEDRVTNYAIPSSAFTADPAVRAAGVQFDA